jgi:RNA polymerase sigma-70 factor (ECF subfamily)
MQAEDSVAVPAVTDAADPPGPALGRAVEQLVLQLPPKERACVLLKDVFDYTIDEIADLVESTPGGVKAALHRGREKLANAPPPAAKRARDRLSTPTRRLLELYVERFNRQDWDGLRDLIAADATLRVADRYEGLILESPYFSRYADLPAPMHAMIGDVDGEAVVALSLEPGGAPRALVRVSFNEERIAAIEDFKHCPWVIAAAGHVSPISAPA